MEGEQASVKQPIVVAYSRGDRNDLIVNLYLGKSISCLFGWINDWNSRREMLFTNGSRMEGAIDANGERSCCVK